MRQRVFSGFWLFEITNQSLYFGPLNGYFEGQL